MANITDPEEYALLIVQQYLRENGHDGALASLERACGRTYVDNKLDRGSVLMQLVYRQMEETLAESVGEGHLKGEEEERLLTGGDDDFPDTVIASVDKLHAGNVIAVACWPGQHKVLTGSGDGIAQLQDFGEDILWRQKVGGGGILCLALHPHTGTGAEQRLLVGSMDGSVSLLDAESGAVLGSSKPHKKYVVRVCWAGDGETFVSASWDQSYAVHRCSPLAAPAAEPGTPFEAIKVFSFSDPVQDVTFLGDGVTAVVALRNTNYLRLFSVASLKELGRVNMNSLGDDHVSFTASHLALSPCSKYMLVSTDSSRIIMFRIQGDMGWEQVRNFYGLHVERFHQPCAAWHSSGFYIFAAAAAGRICIFHVGSAKVVASIKVHSINVRALDYDGQLNLLVSGSFDKTVKVIAKQ